MKNPFENHNAEIETNDTCGGGGEGGKKQIDNCIDDVDNEKNLSSISSINLKIDNNNVSSNVTSIKMDNYVDKQVNGTIFAKKKVKLLLLNFAR